MKSKPRSLAEQRPEEVGEASSVPRRVDKPWGHELIWAHTERYAGKTLFVKQGHKLSVQYHQLKDETLHLLSGRIHLQVGPVGGPLEVVPFEVGDSIRIRSLTVHRMEAIEDSEILEASTPELGDVVRLEDDYGRAGLTDG